MASTQVGKTLALMMAILYCAEHDPAPAMVVLPNEDAAIEFRDRLYATALETSRAGHAKRIRVPSAWKWNNRYVDLGTMRVYLGWSQARQRLRGRPCRRVFDSEIDVYEGDKNAGDPVEQSHQRTKSFYRYLHYHESSPTEHPSPIQTLEQAADVRLRWKCRCPFCRKHQEPRFFPNRHGKGGIKGILDEGGETLPIERVRREAYYECEHCGKAIDQSRKNAFVADGDWYPLDYDPDSGEPLPSLDHLDRMSLGFHLWTIHSETISIGDIAASYVQAKEDGKLRDWWGNTLGLPYRPKSRVPAWVEVGTRLAGDHPRGTVPTAAWFLTAGMDVQGDASGCRYVVRAWAPGKTSWLVDWGWIERQGDELDAGQIVRADLNLAGEQILNTAWPIHGASRGLRSPLGFAELSVRLLNVDSNHMPLKVHQWMRSLPEAWVLGDGAERVRAIRGDSRLGAVRFQRSEIEKNVRTGEEYEGGMTVWRLSVADLYPDFTERLFAPPGKAGSWHVTSDCLTLGKSYLQQVCNLERRIKIDLKTGQRKIEWGPRHHSTPVDFCDCEIYAEFAAEMVVGDMGWSVEAWEVWRQRRQSRTQSESVSRRMERSEAVSDLSDR